MLSNDFYLNNLSVINNFHHGDSLTCTNGKLEITNLPASFSMIEEVEKALFNTLEWSLEENHKNLIINELYPGGRLERISESIDEIRDDIIPKDHNQQFETVSEQIHDLQKNILEEYDNKSITNLNNFTESWFAEEQPVTIDEQMQETVLKGLEWIEWKMSHGKALRWDLTYDIQDLDYGGRFDELLFILEAMDGINNALKEKIQRVREAQQQIIEEKIQWVEKTCPELAESITKMMLSRRIASHPNLFQDPKIDTFKKMLSPEKPHKNIASTSFEIKTVHAPMGKIDILQASQELLSKNVEDVATQVEFYAKPNLGEPDNYLSQVELNYDDVIETMQNMPSKIDFSGFLPGTGAIRERLAYKLQEAIGVDFGVPPIVILDANFKEFHLDELAEALFNQGWLENESNPLSNPFTCFIKYAENAKTINDNNEKQISEDNSHKPLINTLLLNADGHLDNGLVKENNLIPIDFSFSIPVIDSTGSLTEIRQCKNLLMDIPVVQKPLNENVRQILENIDIERVISIIREDVSLHVERFGEKCILPEVCYTMIKLNLLLIKIGAMLNKTPQEIDAMQCPIRKKVDGKIQLLGGEYIKIYQEFIQNQEDIDWESVENILATRLSLPFEERVTEDKGFSNLRLRKII